MNRRSAEQADGSGKFARDCFPGGSGKDDSHCEAELSLAPNFSWVLMSLETRKPFQRFSPARGKLLKQFPRVCPLLTPG
jgi:hypothetical protein